MRVQVGAYVPPAPGEVPGLMRELLDWWNDEAPALSLREIWHGLDISKQGAMDLIRPLVKAKLIKRVGTLKNGRYVLR
jgi:DNA-binding Lrp family transcriptional regulator